MASESMDSIAEVNQLHELLTGGQNTYLTVLLSTYPRSHATVSCGRLHGADLHGRGRDAAPSACGSTGDGRRWSGKQATASGASASGRGRRGAAGAMGGGGWLAGKDASERRCA